MIQRAAYLSAIRRTLRENPVCALLGPRQCGKSTLARQVASGEREAHLFDLEDPSDRARLSEPWTALSGLHGLVIIDEVQRLPGLFSLLRPLADRSGRSARFLILGSASASLVRGVSESLAGRVGFVDLGGLDLREVGSRALRRLWLRGGFPRSHLAPNDAASLRWREGFIRTFLERDIPQLGIRVAPEMLRRFWMMVAHTHAQIWSGAEIARSLGVTEHTVRGYLDILSGAYIFRLLPPWFENIAKRQYRSPKVYIRDSGLFHALLGLGTEAALQSHPKYGASWEGFAVEQALAAIGGTQAYYWGTHNGAELDLMILKGGRRYGVEFKCADAPAMTKSLHIALEDLRLDRAWIVYPGDHRYPIHDRVEALPLKEAPGRFQRLGR